ncbi:FeoB-associated Cys-rich membrane protein [uncultured Clostridium sp.]|uniref:FeoB-associated Cys-rich membrane protein n=1 Tax=uncultured Clostridium sp. TaxID=59620 RepID=UPI0025876034|nr:FeoB-associated Cys-rich membrane protein [uncultured Clostridium sp.]MDU1350162.1 FeoB-associated Cys-rich membrane protein [Clostridium argentinense]
MIEILVTGGILIASAIILVKQIKKKGIGECNCGSCSAKCPSCKDGISIKKSNQ